MAFYDQTDSIGNRNTGGYLIEFLHIPTGEVVKWKAFLTDFNDQYTSDWNEEKPFGRMDAISTFKATFRVITLGWEAPAASVEEAKENLREAEKFISMLYPMFEERYLTSRASIDIDSQRTDVEQQASFAVENGLLSEEQKSIYVNYTLQSILDDQPIVSSRRVGHMSAAPLFKLKFANLIIDPSSGGITGDIKKSGLVGRLSGLSYKIGGPELKEGFFGPGSDPSIKKGSLVPQTISFNCQFTVMHTNPLGYSLANKNKRTPEFPYRSRKVTGV
jgi:hypothetical protein